jgi:hypothetical protein
MLMVVLICRVADAGARQCGDLAAPHGDGRALESGSARLGACATFRATTRAIGPTRVRPGGEVTVADP